jgi:hypothetical protein
MFKLDLSQITENAACSADHFFLKSGGSTVIEYPNGWQPSDSSRVAKENPIALLWLVSKRLIPVGFSEANRILDETYGKEKATEIRDAFRDAGRSRAPKAQPVASPAVSATPDAPRRGGILDSLKNFRGPASGAASSTKPSPDSIIERMATVSREGKKGIFGTLLKKGE